MAWNISESGAGTTHNRSDELLLIDGVPTTITDELRWSFAAENPHAEGRFETLRIENGKGVDPGKHLRRLAEISDNNRHAFSAFNQNDWKICRAINHVHHASIRADENCCDAKIFSFTAQNILRRQKIHLSDYSAIERTHPAAKSLPYDDCYKAHQKAIKPDVPEALLVDSDGHITEGAY